MIKQIGHQGRKFILIAFFLLGKNIANSQSPDSIEKNENGYFIQIYFEGGVYLHSGIYYGAGNIFVKCPSPVRKEHLYQTFNTADTIYIIEQLDYSIPHYLKYIANYNEKSLYYENSEFLNNKKLLHKLNKNSYGNWKITSITYRVVNLSYRISKIGQPVDKVFLNISFKKNYDGLFIFRKVTPIYILPPS